MLKVALYWLGSTLIVIEWVLGIEAKRLIIYKYDLYSVEDATGHMAVDNHHIDYLGQY
jgi:hypothetical protein